MEPIERIFVTLTENQIRQGYSLRDAANTAYGQMTYSEIGHDNAIKHFEKLLNSLKDLKVEPDPEPEPVGAEEEESIAEELAEEELPGVAAKTAKPRK